MEEKSIKNNNPGDIEYFNDIVKDQYLHIKVIFLFLKQSIIYTILYLSKKEILNNQ